MDTFSTILEHKIVAIIRGADPGDVMKIAGALYKGGIKVLEVTFNSPGAIRVVEELSKEMGDSLLIGMGTVLDAKTAKNAISAGAKFIISPSVDTETIKVTKESGVVSVPGAFTPTEIVNAFNAGGDIIKLFPASGNVSYMKEVRAPLSQIPLMPTGGITVDNMQLFYEAGAVAFGIGTALVNTKEKVTDEYLEQLAWKAKQFVQKILTFNNK